MMQFFKRKRYEPIQLGYGCNLYYGDIPKELLQRASIISKKMAECADNLYSAHMKKNHPMYGYSRIQECHGLYDPNDDSVLAIFRGPCNFSFKCSADEFLVNKTNLKNLIGDVKDDIV